MKKCLLLILSTVLLSSCVDNVSGDLQLKENMTFNKRKGGVTVAAGNYDAVLKFKTKKKLVLKLIDTDGDKVKIKFYIPKGVYISPKQGEFKITAAESGQPFDLLGSVDTVTTTSPIYQSSETCSIYRSIRVCRVVRGGGTRCRYVSRTEYGRRYFSYYNELDQRTFGIDLNLPGSDNTVGAFDGQRKDLTTHRVNQSMCILRYGSYRYDYRHRGRYGRFGNSHW